MADAEITAYLEGVVGAVEADSFARFALWEECHDRGGMSWEESRIGHGRTIGELAGMPVHLSLYTVTVKGHKILFYDATSQVVDHRMVEDWLRENLPPSAFDGERLNKTDAMNFHNIFPRTSKAA